MNKKVIFVGGTSFSGSTFFHLTLANDPAGFAAGEVFHLFRPMRERHLPHVMVCGCGDPTCMHWDQVKKRGERNLYESIFELNPEVDFIVDASKNIVWIEEYTNHLERQGIQVQHVVIWKTLLEFAHSLNKKNRLQEGEGLKDWTRYHRTFYSFLKDWRSVKYREYTQDQATVLNAVCRYLEIPYFDGKERFWEKSHHVLGGNPSSRIHLYRKDSVNYQNVQKHGVGTQGGLKVAETHHREVYYENPDQELLSHYVSRIREQSNHVSQIEDMLENRNVLNLGAPTRDWPGLQMSPAEMQAKRLWHRGKFQIGQIRMGYKNWRLGKKTKADDLS
jgi:hypothetical protein